MACSHCLDLEALDYDHKAVDKAVGDFLKKQKDDAPPPNDDHDDDDGNENGNVFWWVFSFH